MTKLDLVSARLVKEEINSMMIGIQRGGKT